MRLELALGLMSVVKLYFIWFQLPLSQLNLIWFVPLFYERYWDAYIVMYGIGFYIVSVTGIHSLQMIFKEDEFLKKYSILNNSASTGSALILLQIIDQINTIILIGSITRMKKQV